MYSNRKNKWERQYIDKKFKNRHNHSYYWNHNETQSMWNKQIRETIEGVKRNYDIDDIVIRQQTNIIPIWNCSKCTYQNIERLRYCTICRHPYSINTVNTIIINDKIEEDELTKCNNLLSEYIEPLLQQYTVMEDDYDESIQIAISQSLSIQKMKTDQIDYVQTRKQLNRSNKSKNMFFADYWQQMTEFETNLQKITKLKQEKERKAQIKKQRAIQNQIQQMQKEEMLLKKLNICVTLKFFPKENIGSMKKLLIGNHKLMECQLNVYNDKWISCSLIPCTTNLENEYEILNNILVPIEYDKNEEILSKNEYYSKWCWIHQKYYCHNIDHNNCELMSIAQYVWRSRLPQYYDINPIWRLSDIHHKNKNILIQYNLYEVMINYLPSMDILSCILFPYLGYHQIDIVKIDGSVKIPVLQQHNEIIPENKLLFMDNYDALPFLLFDTHINFRNASQCSSDAISVIYPFKKQEMIMKPKDITNKDNHSLAIDWRHKFCEHNPRFIISSFSGKRNSKRVINVIQMSAHSRKRHPRSEKFGYDTY